MRRPARTLKQRLHDREQRALLRLRRAAVTYSVAAEQSMSEAEVFTELQCACDAYRNALSVREQRRMTRKP